MKRIDILGAGPAGLAAAHFAKKNNIPFQLYESESKIGGNCKTFEFDGCKYDTGAHRFHNKNNIATQTVKDLIGDDLISVVAPSKIYWQEKMINFPLDPVSVIKNFKTSTIFKIIAENLLNIFKIDKSWENGKAKDQLILLFDTLGNKNELVLKARRKLSSIIFS